MSKNPLWARIPIRYPAHVTLISGRVNASGAPNGTDCITEVGTICPNVQMKVRGRAPQAAVLSRQVCNCLTGSHVIVSAIAMVFRPLQEHYCTHRCFQLRAFGDCSASSSCMVILHLALNMLTLYIVGTPVDARLGRGGICPGASLRLVGRCLAPVVVCRLGSFVRRTGASGAPFAFVRGDLCAQKSWGRHSRDFGPADNQPGLRVHRFGGPAGASGRRRSRRLVPWMLISWLAPCLGRPTGAD